MNSTKIAAAFRALADAFEAVETDVPSPPAEAPTPAPAPRGRGRPPKAAEAPAAAPAAPAPAPDPDPLDAPPVPSVTQDDVRTALKALAALTSQETALAVLKDVGGAVNLSGLEPAKYAAVIAASSKAVPAPKPLVEADPFETAAAPEPAKEAAKEPTLEEVRAAVVAAQKKTGVDTVQKVVMDHGGKVAKDGGGYGPSLKAIPVTQYAALIAAVQNLPTTK